MYFVYRVSSVKKQAKFSSTTTFTGSIENGQIKWGTSGTLQIEFFAHRSIRLLKQMLINVG